MSIYRTIYIAIMTDSSRIKSIELNYDAWIKEFLKKSFCSKIRFFGHQKIETNNRYIQDNYIDSMKYKGDISRDLLSSKLLVSLQDFLNNSSADWFLRLCDDTFVNLRAFDKFYFDLNHNIDPLSERLIQGNCIYKASDNIYLQGGSGMIFSRFSALEFYSNFSFFKILSLNIHNDDTAIGAWLRHRKYSSKIITNRYFIGHLFKGFHTFINLTKSSIMRCGFEVSPPRSRFCRSFLTNLNEIVFWHDRVNFMKFLPYVNQFVSTLPNDLFFYQIGSKPLVCRGVNLTGKYYD